MADPEKVIIDDSQPSHDYEKGMPHQGRGSVVSFSHPIDADDAMKALAGLGDGEVLVLDEVTNRQILRKIDLHIMPIMCIVYAMNFLDKTTLSYGSIMGLRTDLDLVGNDYSWLGSLFYFGYLAWEYPTNRLLQRLPLGKYSSFCIVMWGLTLALFGTCYNFSGAVAVRFFLGVFEASVTPGFALLTSQWYTKYEQGTRTAIWFSFNGWAQIFGGLVAYGFATGSTKHGFSIAPWKALFIFTGCLTVCMGLVFFWLVPDSQLNARWLTPRERLLAVERVRVNQQGIGNKKFKFYQFKEALLDPLAWAFFFFALIEDIPNGGLTNFFSLIIEGFGFTSTQSLLYGTPAGAVEVVTLTIFALTADRFKNRMMVGVIGITIALLGSILLVALPASNPHGRLAGYYLTQAAPLGFVALLSLISTNVAGYTKKTTVAAMYLIGYCVGNIIGPQTFQAKDAPNYTPAKTVICVCYALSIIDLVGIYFYCRWQNRKKRAITERPDYVRLENQEWLDLTDKENPEFIYSL